MLKERLSAIAIVVLLGVFILGAVRLLHLRYDQGDVYPAYSSLRADPLGAKALYEGLDGLPGLTVSRLFSSLDHISSRRDTTLFVFGASDFQIRDLERADYDSLQRFLAGGGRLVFTLYPQALSLSWTNAEHTPSHKKSATNDLEAEFRPISLERAWGFKFAALPLLVDSGQVRSEEASLADTNSGLPRLVSWHSALCFDPTNASWHTIYSRQKRPVLMERPMGGGSIVLASDSYFLSNEALRAERHPALLAWLAGSHRNLVFDETHLGVDERPGIAMLARRYHLTGVAAALAVVAALFVWRNAVSFLPPLDEPLPAAGLVAGRDSAAGLVSLLRRSVPPTEIIDVCLTEWRRHAFHPEKAAALAAILAAEKAKPSAQRSPLAAYRAMQQLLTRKI